MKSLTSFILENSPDFRVEEAERFYKELSDLFKEHPFYSQLGIHTRDDPGALYAQRKKALVDPTSSEPIPMSVEEFIALLPPPPPFALYPLPRSSYKIAGVSSGLGSLYDIIREYKQKLENLKAELEITHISILGNGRPNILDSPTIHVYQGSSIMITYPPYVYPLEEKVKRLSSKYPKWKHDEGDPPEHIPPHFNRSLRT